MESDAILAYAGAAPIISSQPESQTVTTGTNITFAVSGRKWIHPGRLAQRSKAGLSHIVSYLRPWSFVCGSNAVSRFILFLSMTRRLNGAVLTFWAPVSCDVLDVDDDSRQIVG